MKACVGNTIAIKVTGGFRTIEDTLLMIEAGAMCIGTSRGVEIVEGYKALQSTH
jgi:deoxyribose-phosphate aldolase